MKEAKDGEKEVRACGDGTRERNSKMHRHIALYVGVLENLAELL